MNLKYFLFLILIKSNLLTIGQTPSFQIALAKYNGGGDWYANPTALPNLIKFCNKNMNANMIGIIKCFIRKYLVLQRDFSTKARKNK